MKFLNEKKLEKIELNNNNFYVVIDFDKTITSKDSNDSWAAAGNLLGEEFITKTDNLYNKYVPIEKDYSISFEEKTKHMETWYRTVMKYYYDYKLTKTKLERSIKNSKVILRKGAKEFLAKMYEKNIPVIILSAGIGNVIEIFLKENSCYFDNIKLITNFIEFDENGNMKKQVNQMIHSLNKTMEGHISKELKDKLVEKEHTLLVGDLVEDKKMAEGSNDDKTIYTSFLNSSIEENLEVYKKNFDIVLTEDEANFQTISDILFNKITINK